MKRIRFLGVVAAVVLTATQWSALFEPLMQVQWLAGSVQTSGKATAGGLPVVVVMASRRA